MTADGIAHELVGRRIGSWTMVRTARRGTDGRTLFIVSDGQQERALRGYELVREMHAVRAS